MYPDLTPPQIKADVAAAAGQFLVVKAFKRLFILDRETARGPERDGSRPLGCLIYTPPDWLRVPDRKRLQLLADRFNARGAYHVRDVMAFEVATPRHRSYPPHAKNPENRLLPFDGTPEDTSQPLRSHG